MVRDIKIVVLETIFNKKIVYPGLDQNSGYDY